MQRVLILRFFFSSRRRHTRCSRDWSSDVCSSDLLKAGTFALRVAARGDPESERPGLQAAGRPSPPNPPQELKGGLLVAPVGRGTYVRSEERRVGKECMFRWWSHCDKVCRQGELRS